MTRSAADRPGLVARTLSSVVGAYQVVRRGRPSPCRFSPSCSAYARDALEIHGAARGGWLALRRVCRCHPWGGQGWDPVPARRPNAASPAGSPPERKVA